MVIWSYIGALNSTTDESSLQFASPAHYAAYFSYCATITRLCDCGSNIDYTSMDSKYGALLSTAIWGLRERQFALLRGRIIPTILLVGAYLNTGADSGYLGHRKALKNGRSTPSPVLEARGDRT